MLRPCWRHCCSRPPSFAQYYWDTNGSGAGSGNAGGAWNTGTNWTTNSGGTTTTIGWTDGNEARFSAGTDGVGTLPITITGTVSPTNLIIEEGTISLAAGTISATNGIFFRGNPSGMNISGTANVTAANYLVLGDASGAVTTVNQSGGTVTNNGSTNNPAGNNVSNRWGHWGSATTNYNLSGGTLNLQNAPLYLSWDGAATLTISGTGVANINGIEMGYGARVQNSTINLNGGGTLNIGAAGITSSGTTNKTINLNGGTLGALAAWSTTRPMNVLSTTTIDTTGGAIALNGALTGVGGLNLVGSNTTTFGASNTIGGISGSGNLANSGTLTLTQIAGTVSTHSGNITGGSIVVRGENDNGSSSRQVLTGTHTGLGNISVQHGNTANDVSFLELGGSGSTTATSVSVGTSGATAGTARLDITGSRNLTVNGNFFLGEQNGFAGTGNQTTTGTVTVNGEFRVGHWPNETSTYNMGNGALTVNGAGTTAESAGVITLGIDGTGIFNHTGGTVTTRGIYLDARTATTGTDQYNLSGGTLILTHSLGISGNATTSTFQVNLGGGTIQANTATNISVPAVLTGTGGNVTFNTNGNSININGPSGQLSGAGGFIKDGAGTLTISSTDNTFSGNIHVKNGTLLFNSAANTHPIGTNAARTITIDAGATLTANAGTHNPFGVNGEPPLVIVNGTMNTAAYQHMQGIQMTGGLIQPSVAEAATESGLDMKNSPTVQTFASATTSTIASKMTIATTVTFNVANGAASPDLLVSGAMVGGSGIIKTGAGLMQMSAANTYTGTTTVNNGTLLVTGTLRDSSSFSVNGSGSTLEFGATNIFTLNHGAAMGDTRVITVDGGTLLFNGNFDSRFGNVTLNNGATWNSNRGLGAYDALLANTSVGAATVSVGGVGASVMNGSGGIHLQGVQNFNVSDVTSNSAADLTVSMVLAGPGTTGGAAGGINKQGAGTMLLSAANTYNGATQVSDGTLEIGAGGSIANSSGVTVGLGSGTDTLVLSNTAAHTLGTGDLTVGSTGIGVVQHNAGNVTVGDATSDAVRIGVGAQGTYNLNNGAVSTLNVGPTGARGNLIVGQSNVGIFNVGANATVNTGDLIVGQASTGNGTVNQTGGVINVTNIPTMIVGDAGNGLVNHSGGTTNVAGNLILGNQSSGNGAYNLSQGVALPPAILDVSGNVSVGAEIASGTGVFTQSGGTHNVAGNMTIGNSTTPAVQNSYTLSGGTLDFGDRVTITQAPASSTNPASILKINADGDFNLTNNGTLRNVTTIDVASAPGSIFQQDGGRFVVGVDGGLAIRDGVGFDAQRAMTTIVGGSFDQNGGTLAIDIFGNRIRSRYGEPRGPTDLGNNPINGLITDSDLLYIANGNATLDGTLEINLNGVEPRPWAWYDVMVANQIFVEDDFNLVGINLWRVINDPTTSGRQILQVAIPEPLSITLWSGVALLVAGIYCVRRRKT